jgi:hypothetical protein
MVRSAPAGEWEFRFRAAKVTSDGVAHDFGGFGAVPRKSHRVDSRPVGRLQRTIGVVLVVGLLAGSAVGFAVAQAGKSVTPYITATDFTHARWVSPTCACPTAAAAFRIDATGAPDVGIRIVTDPGSLPVRTLATHVSTRSPISMAWNGRRDDGSMAADGTYRVQLVFPKQVRTVVDRIQLDTHPPLVQAQLPTGAVLPGTGRATYSFRLTSDEAGSAVATVYRVEPDQSVAEVWRQPTPTPVTAGAPVTLSWNGQRRNPAGRAAPGVYIVGYEVTDRAGNLARSPQTFARGSLGDAATVRIQNVDVTPSGAVLTPATGALSYTVARLDARGGTTVSQAGMSSGRRVPAAQHAGLYLTTATVGGLTGTGYDAEAGVARTLLVVPSYTWQAANAYDAAADGFPDVPPAPLGLDRPLPDAADAVRGLIADAAGPLRRHPRYGAITDAELEAGVPSQVRLLVVAGMQVWTTGFRRAVRQFTRSGGRVVYAASPLDRLGTVTGGALVVGAVPRPAGLS